MNQKKKSEKNKTLEDHPFIFLMNQEFKAFGDFLSEQMDRLYLLDKALEAMGEIPGNHCPMDGGYQSMLLTACKDMREIIINYHGRINKQRDNLSHIEWGMDKQKTIKILAPYLGDLHGVKCSDGKISLMKYEDMEYLLLNRRDDYEEMSSGIDEIWQWWLQACEEIQKGGSDTGNHG